MVEKFINGRLGWSIMTLIGDNDEKSVELIEMNYNTIFTQCD